MPEATNPVFAERVAASFARQGIMATIGARLGRVAPGEVEITLPVATAVTQQHGFVHAGVVAAIADSACGYAALSLMPSGAGVLTTEFKINLMSPAGGDSLIARGRVIKAGRTISAAQAEVYAVKDGQEKLCALLTASLMTIEGRDGISD